MNKRPHICTPGCFVIERDGRKLKTRECRHKLAREAAEFNRAQKAKRKLWNGEAR